MACFGRSGLVDRLRRGQDGVLELVEAELAQRQRRGPAEAEGDDLRGVAGREATGWGASVLFVRPASLRH